MIQMVVVSKVWDVKLDVSLQNKNWNGMFTWTLTKK